MTLIVILIVLAAEFYFRWGAEFRSYAWFESIQAKLYDLMGDKPFYEGWGGVALILLTPVVILALVISAFPQPLYYLALFLISIIVLFMSLGPIALKQTYSVYFEAMERGDSEAGYLSLQQAGVLNDLSESDPLVRNATRSILVESQTRYFGVIFWFIFLGPYGALFYRLSHYYAGICNKESLEEHGLYLDKLLHIIDWAPARLTSCLFLLTGDFVNGFYRVKDYLFDLNADNRHLISETGIAALGLDLSSSDEALDENHNALAMVERTVIIYLVVAAALSPVAFW